MKAKRDAEIKEEELEDKSTSGDGGDSKKKLKRYFKFAAIGVGGALMVYNVFFSGDQTKDPADSKADNALEEPKPEKLDIDLQNRSKGVLAEPKPSDNVIENQAFNAKIPLERAQTPSIKAPMLPDLPDFKFEEPKAPIPKQDEEKKIAQSKATEEKAPEIKIDKPQEKTPTLPTLPPPIDVPSGQDFAKIETGNLQNPDAAVQAKKEVKMFVISNGNDSGSSTQNQQKKSVSNGESDFIIYDKTRLIEGKTGGKEEVAKDNEAQVTKVEDLENKILQGKMLDVVLETAINSQLPGPVRGIVARDVFGESGTKILIPKGTRIYGTYQSTIQRGQSRLAIGWNRVIRPDGISISLSAQAADQFGRAGIEADVDNRFGEIFGNSLLLSFVNLGAAVALQKITGTDNGQTQMVNSNGTVATTNINPVNLAAQSVIENTKSAAEKLTAGSSMLNPIALLPQGTRIKVVVNQDMTIPDFKKQKLT
jgi:type IV secretion system protein VirB10